MQASNAKATAEGGSFIHIPVDNLAHGHNRGLNMFDGGI